MGKTRATYRDRLQGFENDWNMFRRSLIKEYQPHWDEVIVQAHYTLTQQAMRTRSSRSETSFSRCSSARRNASPNSRSNWRRVTMATTEREMYPDQVEEFAEEWCRFRGLLPKSERDHWDVFVKRAKNRPYPGHCQFAQVDDDPKWPTVFTILVTQQAEISRLSEDLHDLEEKITSDE